MILEIGFLIIKTIERVNEKESEAGGTDRIETEEYYLCSLNELLGFEDINYGYPIDVVSSMGSISSEGIWRPAIAFEYDSEQDVNNGDWISYSMYISPNPTGASKEQFNSLTDLQRNRIADWIEEWLDWLRDWKEWAGVPWFDDNYQPDLESLFAPATCFVLNENQLELPLD